MNTVITFLLLTACVVNGQQTTCNVGYQTTCTDVDECQTNRGGCDTHATCKNTAGSFTCTCDAGYSGDGFTCTENFVNLGCFKDTTTRDFDGAGWSDTAMTVKMCLSECAKKGFKYAGLQGNSWCFCGNSYGKYGTATNCDRTCVGDTKDNCGGNMANSVWVSERNFESSHNIGCFADNMERDLIGAYWLSTSLSVDMCVEDCKYRGMSYAALQGSGWCMCGNTYGKHGASTSCNKACTGNANDICGGEFANSIWTTGVNVHYVGCFADTSDRDLNGMSMTETAVMTIQICLDNCRGKGFKYAGLQNQSYCFCGNSYGKHGTSTNCNQACIGNAKENCGGFGANAIWTTGK